MKAKPKPRSPLTVLSVDWDYFLPLDTTPFDWGANESPHNSALFFEILWPMRATARLSSKDERCAVDLVQVAERRVKGFWDKILSPLMPMVACIVDSHAEIITFLDRVHRDRPLRIVNFDAHHDCGYPYQPKQKKHVNCGNWAAWLKHQKRLHHLTLVYPQWRRTSPERGADKELSMVDEIVYGKWDREPIAAPLVFLCRSSAWMPSWCDAQWLTLRQGLLARRPITRLECPYIQTARPFERIKETPVPAIA